MAPLTNPRWERFAQALAKGKTATDAYAEAGFAPNRQNAARLTTNDDVKARLAELQNRAAAKTEITVAKLTDMYLDDRRQAKELGQPSAAISAVTALGKLHGLVVDRKEIRSGKLLSDYTDDELAALLADESDAGTDSRRSPPKANGSALTH